MEPYFTLVAESLKKRIPITDEDIAIFCSYLQLKKVKKNRLIHLECTPIDHIYFVAEGLVRLYTTRLDFGENTFEFAAEGTWTVDLKAFRTREQSFVNMEALEDTVLLTIHYDDVQRAHYKIPLLTEFSRLHAEEKYEEAMMRLQFLNHPSLSATERYTEFLNHFEHLNNKIPLQYIASFLGITPETLSRVRRSVKR